MDSRETKDNMRQGVLVRGFGGFYGVVTETGEEYVLRCKKKFRHAKISPLVGDDILFTPGEGEEHGWIEEILPRRSQCIRPPVANVERLILVISPSPEADLLLVDRILVRAFRQGMDAILVINKRELDPLMGERIRTEYRNTGLEVLEVSAARGEGLDLLRDRMKGKLCCMTGQSGVGKSTLLNALLGLELETGEISRKIERGKNTTRHAELLIKDGLRVLDTAGFSLLEMEENMDPVTLREWYPEFAEYEGMCRFDGCCHDREPGCAVTEACREGKLGSERVERYRILLGEVKEHWRGRYD